MTFAPKRIAPQPWMTAPETRAVVDALTKNGGRVRFVGGCVRDALAGRPVKDIDLATPDPPEIVMRRLAAEDIRVVPTGIAHGTVTAVVGGKHFEITTLRQDVETFGRRATVAFTDDWTADAARRDFTINSLSLDFDGTLHDPYDGVADLLDEIAERLKPEGASRTDARATEAPAPAPEVAVAIVGRPNVGKSSLVNRLLREERVLVSDMPGTTRDAVDTVLTWHRRRFRIVDTAGTAQYSLELEP